MIPRLMTEEAVWVDGECETDDLSYILAHNLPNLHAPIIDRAWWGE